MRMFLLLSIGMFFVWVLFFGAFLRLMLGRALRALARGAAPRSVPPQDFRRQGIDPAEEELRQSRARRARPSAQGPDLVVPYRVIKVES